MISKIIMVSFLFGQSAFCEGPTKAEFDTLKYLVDAQARLISQMKTDIDSLKLRTIKVPNTACSVSSIKWTSLKDQTSLPFSTFHIPYFIAGDDCN
jgi:hypothetical protein